jgi:hypothetical protein
MRRYCSVDKSVFRSSLFDGNRRTRRIASEMIVRRIASEMTGRRIASELVCVFLEASQRLLSQRLFRPQPTCYMSSIRLPLISPTGAAIPQALDAPKCFATQPAGSISIQLHVSTTSESPFDLTPIRVSFPSLLPRGSSLCRHSDTERATTCARNYFRRTAVDQPPQRG